jgi:hypothetical protein
MRYTKPQILRINEAISAIQEQDDTGTSKNTGSYFDIHPLVPIACTKSAYQADE